MPFHSAAGSSCGQKGVRQNVTVFAKKSVPVTEKNSSMSFRSLSDVHLSYNPAGQISHPNVNAHMPNLAGASGKRKLDVSTLYTVLVDFNISIKDTDHRNVKKNL